MEKRDVVYILRNDITGTTDELLYSLRSVAENFPVRFVWFVGGCPEGFYPDKMIKHEQTGGTKWERAKSSLIEACRCKEISDEFYLFNDDFYVLKEPTGDFINFVNGTIGKRVADIVINNRGGTSAYTRGLDDLARRLRRMQKDTLSFAVHMPLLVDKKKMLDLLTGRNAHFSFRSLYGNYYEIPYIYHKDVKIYTMNEEPGEDWDYLSTTEQSFAFGKVGEWIRKRFPNPCKYEQKPKGKNYARELYSEDGDEIYN